MVSRIGLDTHLSRLQGVGTLEKMSHLQENIPGNKRPGQADETRETFGSLMKQEIEKVNTQMVRAEDMMSDLATGKSANVHGTMMEMQKADLSFRMLLAVRKKAISAYEEVMRIQP